MNNDTNPETKLTACVVERSLQEKVFEIEPIENRGTVNRVFKVTTVTQRLIVRMSTRKQALQEYRKERWCMEAAQAAGVATAGTLAIDSFKNYHYMIQTFVEGTLGDVPKADGSAVWRGIGESLRKIHTIPAKGWGPTMKEGSKGSFTESWEQHLRYNIKSLTGEDPLLALNALDSNTSDILKEAFTSLLDKDLSLTLNHGDAHPRNTIQGNNGALTMLDWGSATAHVAPHYDFGEILRGVGEASSEFEEVLEGYGMSRGEFLKLLPEIRLLETLRSIDTLRWALDSHQKDLSHYLDTLSRSLRCCSYTASFN